MALKDWKKTKPFEWKDEDKRRHVWLTTIPKSKVVYANAIYYKEGVMIFNKRFENRDKALRYITNYMKKH